MLDLIDLLAMPIALVLSSTILGGCIIVAAMIRNAPTDPTKPHVDALSQEARDKHYRELFMLSDVTR